jgi:hypothetical protein
MYVLRILTKFKFKIVSILLEASYQLHSLTHSLICLDVGINIAICFVI